MIALVHNVLVLGMLLASACYLLITGHPTAGGWLIAGSILAITVVAKDKSKDKGGEG